MSPSVKNQTNQPCKLLSSEDNALLFRLISDGCQTLSSCIVQLLVTDPPHYGSWRKLACGTACFIKNNRLQSFFIQVFDLSLERCIWQQELYLELDYQRPTAYFHMFEAESCSAALNFTDEAEALEFSRILLSKLSILRRQYSRSLSTGASISAKESSTSLDGPSFQTHLRKGPDHGVSSQQQQAPNPRAGISSPVPQPPTKTVIQRGETNRIAVKKRPIKKKEDKMTRLDISAPLTESFQHVSHIGFDPSTGFQYDSKDSTIEELFRLAGIDIKAVDASEIDFLYGFIESKLGGLSAVKAAASRKVRAPSTASVETKSRTSSTNSGEPRGRAPPPPVVNLGQNNRSVSPMGSSDEHRRRPPLPPPVPPTREESLPQLPSSYESLTSNVPPPPPPPFKSLTSNVPPPPPPAPVISVTVADSRTHDRGLLFSEIKNGVRQLKAVEQEASRPDSISGRDQLMVDIRNKSMALKPVLATEAPTRDDSPLDGMAAALARALAVRRGAIEIAEDEGDEMDDEWEA